MGLNKHYTCIICGADREIRGSSHIGRGICRSCASILKYQNRRLFTVGELVRRTAYIVSHLRRLSEFEAIRLSDVNSRTGEINLLEVDIENLADDLTVKIMTVRKEKLEEASC